MRTKWNLKLFYSSPKDPQIEKDLKKFELVFKKFVKKYKNKKDYLKDESTLLQALKDYESLLEEAKSKPIYYFFYLSALNSSNQEAEAMSNKLSDRLTKIGNEAIFFTINLGKIDRKQQKIFLNSKKLSKYHYFLELLFEESSHTLTTPEEKILNLKSLTSRSLWISGLEKALNKQTVRHKGKDISLPEASSIISGLKAKERRELHQKLFKAFKDVSDFAEAEINAIYTDKKIGDELRHYKEPYSATIMGYENEEKSVLSLVGAVTEEFRISKRFYGLKKKLLGLSHLTYADRSAPIGKVKKKFDFKTSHDLLREIFYDMHPEYGKILDRFIKNGQIDVYPKKGKSGGAFCSSDTSTPTLVLLNHADTHSSFSTFAHEMGHAVHAERSKKLSVLYDGHSTAVAETASTLFETIAFNKVFDTLSPKDKVIALHDKIQNDIATIFRQIACFNFELELHTSIRESGSVSKEEIAKLMNKHMKAYLGPSFKITDSDGYFFVNWSHIRNFFYVYSYSYGQLISKVLHQKYIEDPNYIDSIDSFLSSGQSKRPEKIFEDIGIKTDLKLFKSGLTSIDKDITALENLTLKK